MAILQLFTGEDKVLLVGWNALLVLNLGLHIVDGVGGLNLQGDCLANKSLHEDGEQGGASTPSGC